MTKTVILSGYLFYVKYYASLDPITLGSTVVLCAVYHNITC